MTSWTDYQDDISDAISDSMDVDWSASVGARAVVAWLNENKPLIADTPRVTVPVEPTEAMMKAADAVDWNNEDERASVINMWQAMISAAPAPEGGAVEATGARAVIRNGQIVISIDVDALPLILSGSIALNAVAGTFKVTDAPTFAKEVCHALNAEKEDGTTRVHMMFDSAFNHAIDQGAEGVEEISEDEFEAEASRLQAEAASALATREEAPAHDFVQSHSVTSEGGCKICGRDEEAHEAPAEAGESLHPHAQPFEQYPELALHIERMAMSGVVGSMISWDAFLRELNAALRAQPQAREDAQPVWVDGVPTKHHAKEWFIAETTFGDRVVLTALPEEYTYDFKTADETYIKSDRIKRWMPFPDSQYLFPHPAPDALRDAERYRYLRSRDPGPDGALPPAGLFIGRVPDNVILTEGDADAAIDQALGALREDVDRLTAAFDGAVSLSWRRLNLARDLGSALTWALAEIDGETKYEDDGQRENCRDKADQALAALQAEQKGGA